MALSQEKTTTKGRCAMKEMMKCLFAMVFLFVMAYVFICLAFIAGGCGGGGGHNGGEDTDDLCPACQNDADPGGDKDGVKDYAGDNPDLPPKPDVPPYVCPDPNKPPEMCKPKAAKEAFCSDLQWLCYGAFIEGMKKCSTDAECQTVPTREELIAATEKAVCLGGNCEGKLGLNYEKQCWGDDKVCQKIPQEVLDNPNYPYPPCVCWEFCGFFGEWDCSENYSLVFFPSDDGLCHLGTPDGLNKTLGKPGDPNPRYPLENPEISYILSPDGQKLTELISGVTCTRPPPPE